MKIINHILSIMQIWQMIAKQNIAIKSRKTLFLWEVWFLWFLGANIITNIDACFAMISTWWNQSPRINLSHMSTLSSICTRKSYLHGKSQKKISCLLKLFQKRWFQLHFGYLESNFTHGVTFLIFFKNRWFWLNFGMSKINACLQRLGCSHNW